MSDHIPFCSTSTVFRNPSSISTKPYTVLYSTLRCAASALPSCRSCSIRFTSQQQHAQTRQHFYIPHSWSLVAMDHRPISRRPSSISSPARRHQTLAVTSLPRHIPSVLRHNSTFPPPPIYHSTNSTSRPYMPLNMALRF